MARDRKKYTVEFKAEAVRLARSRDTSVAQLSRDLGVNAEVLRSWVRRSGKAEEAASPPEESLEVENRRLRRENARLTEERDILKKAAAYFASVSR